MANPKKVIVILAFLCAVGDILGEIKDPCSVGEMAGLEAFLIDLSRTYNAKDEARIKLLTGKAACRWVRWNKGKGLIEKIEIVGCSSNGATNVTVRVYVLDGTKGARSFDAVFSMRKDNDAYYMEDMVLPESDRRNQMFKAAVGTSEKLIKCINAGDFSGVKDLLTCDSSSNLDEELSKRGLVWIKEAITNGVRITRASMIVQRGRRGRIEGILPVPSSRDGTNVVRKVVFSGSNSKIDRMSL